MRANAWELVALAAVSVFHWTHYDWIGEILGHFLLVPPTLFIDDIRPRLGKIWVYASLAVLGCCEQLCCVLQQYLDTEKYLNDGELWAKVACAAGALFCLPVYFTVVRPPTTQQKVPNFSRTFRDTVVPLPCGLDVGFRQGLLIDAVIKSRECRAAVVAYCVYVALVFGTIAIAEYVYRCSDIFAAVTFLSYLCVLSVVSLVYCGPRFIWPGLNTRRSAMVLYFIVFPAALAATYGLQATEIVELDTIHLYAKSASFYLKLALNLVAPPPAIRCVMILCRRWLRY